jgi:hypothetical protein
MKTNLEGVRIHFIVPKRTQEFLQKYSRKTGITVSEHLRRAIDQYIRALAADKK